jgi:UDP-N-acetylmuramoyl-tripeptide--D-alanyl-D-alanine ligase
VIAQQGGALGWGAAAACVAATALAGVRWLRVAQREHYLPDSASRFALRWWWCRAIDRLGVIVALGGLVLATRWAAAAFAAAAVVALGPLGMGLRGRTSQLRWTRRLRTLAGVWLLLQAIVVVAGVLSGYAALLCAAGALLVPAFVDLSCTITAPIERYIAERYVRRAAEQLRKVGPKVVAVTGSFGKTSTKGYIAHLLSGSMSVVASPASFNNRAGLARAVNENLAEGTEVFVAEMGTYGRGEIAELCSWLEPQVSVITAIGPVHLERFGSEEEIVRAKSEIVERASCCVLPVDDSRLAELADRCATEGKRVWRVSAENRSDAEVRVLEDGNGFDVTAGADPIATNVVSPAHPRNVACAVAVALEVGVPPEVVSKRLQSLPVAPHRLEPSRSPGGFTILDDTYNSNPAGARAALESLSASAGPDNRRVLVTPGMVELGRRQADENARFAEDAAAVVSDFVVVGRTNRKALVEGLGRADDRSSRVLRIVVDRREEAVAWVREHLGPGDVVLYENDLPDHYC